MKREQKKRFAKWRRHKRIRNRLEGTAERPRLYVFRSLTNIYCQIIDDTFVDKNGNRSGTTLVSCSSLHPSVREKVSYGGNVAAAKVVGAEIAKMAKEKGITKVAFDRGGNKYHGRLKALADAAREGGLSF